MLGAFKFNLKEIKKRLFDKKTAVILIVIGISLIFVSELFATGAKTPKSEQAVTAEEYRADLEKQLSRLIKSIKGAGNASVMITFKSGKEYIYATESKSSQTTVTDSDQSGNKSEIKDGNEYKYIIVDDGNGGEKALLITELLPQIQGVVIVCDGADIPSVKSSVISAASALLGISSNNICVIKKS